MDTASLLKKVRAIELRTRSLSARIFAGEYHSAFKGRGMQFDQVRAYTPGDDIRSIDWNVTARFNEPFVKVFTEERELSLILLVDISSSAQFGTTSILKSELITELAAVLSWSALTNNDQTGALFFSDRVEKVIEPAKGNVHTLRLISDLIQTRPVFNGTKLTAPLEYAAKILRKRSTIFILSDFIDTGYSQALTVLAGKHDVKAIRVYDHREKELPRAGLIYFQELETGNMNLADTGDPVLRKNYELAWKKRTGEIHLQLNRAGVPLMDLKTDESYVIPLTQLLKGIGKKG